MTSKIEIIITGDATSAQKALNDTAKAVDNLGSRGSAANINKPLDASAKSAKQTAAQMQNLNYQITDIGVSLASGQSPFLVFLQQGAQIKDIFGGIGPAFRAVTGAAFSLGGAIAGGAAVLGGFALAAYQGNEQAKELDKNFRLAGAGAVTTTGQFMVSTRQISAATGDSLGNVRELGLELQKMAGIGRSSYNAILQAAASFQKASGANAEDTAKQFEGITRNAAKWAVETNKSYNFVTAAQVEHLKQLQAQGKSQEAATEAAKLFGDAMKQRVEPNLSTLGRLLASVKSGWDEFWQAAKGATQAETIEEKIARLTDRVKLQQEALDQGRKRGPIETKAAAAAQEQLRALQTVQAASVRARAALTEYQDAENKKIKEGSQEYQSALLSVEQAGIEARYQAAINGLELGRRYTDAQYEQGLTSAQQYQQQLYAIEVAGLDAREQSIRAAAAAAAKIQPDSSEGTLAQQAQQVKFQQQLLEIETKRKVLALDEASGRRNIAPNVTDSGPQFDFRRFENEQRQSDEAAAKQRKLVQMNASHDLVLVNEELTAQLIQGDEARARALLAIELDRFRKSQDYSELDERSRKEAQDRMAEYAVLRQRQLTEELKPEWQKQLEAWQDVANQQKKITNDMWSDILRDGEDAWVQFAKTGKLSLNQLVMDFLAAQARMQFRSLVAQIPSFLGSFFGYTGGAEGPAGVASGTGKAIGGGVNPMTRYPVLEKGPELLTVGGRTTLMMGDKSGYVTPLKGGGREIKLTTNLTQNIDSRTDQATIFQQTQAAMQETERRIYQQLTAARVIGG